jgi:hypothetical protein
LHFLHSAAKEQSASPYFSITSPLFAKTAGVPSPAFLQLFNFALFNLLSHSFSLSCTTRTKHISFIVNGFRTPLQKHRDARPSRRATKSVSSFSVTC